VEPRLPEGPRPLTERQLEVARLVAGGLTNVEIGERLGISLDGAKYHVSELLTRLDLERREQIAEWVAGERARTRRRGWMLTAVAGAALATAAVAVGGVLLLSSGRADTSLLAATPEVAPSLAAVQGEPTAQPPRTQQVPISLGDLTNEELLDLLYRPLAWNDPLRVNRVPPRSLDQALAERAIYQDGYQFEGAPPAAFDRSKLGTTECIDVRADGAAGQSGDWVLRLVPAFRGSFADAGRYELELMPIDPSVLLTLSGVALAELVTDTPRPDSAVPLRIRAVQTEHWTATHVFELWTSQPVDGAGVVKTRFDSPRAGRWLAIVTAGPLWGCFFVSTECDADGWPATRADVQPVLPYVAPPAGRVAPAPRGHPAVTGSDDRVCVDVGPPSVRSGEIAAAGLLETWADWPVNARSYGAVDWMGLHPESTSLTVRAFVDGDEAGPLHTFEAVDAAEFSRAWYGGLVPGVDRPSDIYRTSFLLPVAGRWTVLAMILPVNWGCFVLDAGTSQPISVWN